MKTSIIIFFIQEAHDDDSSNILLVVFIFMDYTIIQYDLTRHYVIQHYGTDLKHADQMKFVSKILVIYLHLLVLSWVDFLFTRGYLSYHYISEPTLLFSVLYLNEDEPIAYFHSFQAADDNFDQGYSIESFYYILDFNSSLSQNLQKQDDERMLVYSEFQDQMRNILYNLSTFRKQIIFIIKIQFICY